MKKTILEITSNFPGEVFINRHVASLLQQGYPIEVLTRHPKKRNLKSASMQEKLDFDYRLIIFPSIWHLSYADLMAIFKQLATIRDFPPTKSLLRDRVYLEFIKRLNPSLIHFHFGTLAGAMSWIPQELGIPYTLSLRGSDTQIKPFESREKFDAIKDAIKNAAGVHSVSDAIWSLAKSTFSLSSAEIYHKTIYTTVPLGSYNSARTKENNKEFITVGRLHWRKSFPNLLIAFKKFSEIYPDTTLKIIGDGELWDCISYWIRYLQLENNVLMLGKMNYADLALNVQQADGYIQSSIAEGFSNAIAEAMALGCPVFATDVGGTSEIIKDGVNGFLLDPISPESWVEKLKFVYKENLMDTITKNARKTAETKFSSKMHAEEFYEFFQTSIARFNKK